MFRAAKVNVKHLSIEKVIKYIFIFFQGFINLNFFILSIFSTSTIEIDPENMSTISTEFENHSKSHEAPELVAGCVMSSEYEVVKSVVHDVIYQRECLNLTVPACHLTHLQLPRQVLETRSDYPGAPSSLEN